MHKLGFIGTGTMGAPMARRLIAAGYDLVVHDIAREKAASLGVLGVKSGLDAATMLDVRNASTGRTPIVAFLEQGTGVVVGRANIGATDEQA